MDRDSKFTQIKVNRMGGIDQRTSPDDLDAEGRPNFSTLEGLYPSQDGLLSRIPGKYLLTSLPGQKILRIFQPFDSTGNILVQTDQNLYAFTLDELESRTYVPTITASAGSEDESMSLAILSDLRANATSGGPLGAFAIGTLTSTGVAPLNNETVTINGKGYTFQTVLTNVDGHVLIGGSSAVAVVNLFHAINASGGVAGTDYAAATVANTVVRASSPTATTVRVQAITPGAGGNALTTVEGVTGWSWGGGTLAGGAAATADAFFERTINTVESDSAAIVALALNTFTLANGIYRISVECVWNPVDASTNIIGTTIGLWNNTTGLFETYSGTSEPIIGTAGKANTAGNAEACNTIIALEARFTVAAGPYSYSIQQKGSTVAGVTGTSFCGIHDQCTTNSNVNGAKSKNRYLLVKIWKE